MFRSRVAWSILRHGKDAIGTYKLRKTWLTSSTSAGNSFRFSSQTITRQYLHTFRFYPKGHHVPYMRSFCNVASTGAAHKEGTKLLVTGGPQAQNAIAIWLIGSSAWVIIMVVVGGLLRLR